MFCRWQGRRVEQGSPRMSPPLPPNGVRGWRRAEYRYKKKLREEEGLGVDESYFGSSS